MTTTRDFLVRGLLAGLVAGFVAFGVSYFLGEPSVDQAIALEEAAAADPEGSAQTGTDHSHAEPAGEKEEVAEVSRSQQATFGLLTATTVMGSVLGGLAGVVTALGIGRLGRISARATALWVAASGFVVVFLVPYLVYPPNPPAVGSSDTIGQRTGLFFGVLAISVACAVTAVVAGTRLRGKVGGWYATLLGIGGYVVAMVVTSAVMPTYIEVGADFPAQLLFDFRMASLLTQLALWAALGVTLAELAQRMVAPTPRAQVEGQGAPVRA